MSAGCWEVFITNRMAHCLQLTKKDSLGSFGERIFTLAIILVEISHYPHPKLTK